MQETGKHAHRTGLGTQISALFAKAGLRSHIRELRSNEIAKLNRKVRATSGRRTR